MLSKLERIIRFDLPKLLHPIAQAAAVDPRKARKEKQGQGNAPPDKSVYVDTLAEQNVGGMNQKVPQPPQQPTAAQQQPLQLQQQQQPVASVAYNMGVYSLHISCRRRYGHVGPALEHSLHVANSIWAAELGFAQLFRYGRLLCIFLEQFLVLGSELDALRLWCRDESGRIASHAVHPVAQSCPPDDGSRWYLQGAEPHFTEEGFSFLRVPALQDLGTSSPQITCSVVVCMLLWPEGRSGAKLHNWILQTLVWGSV